MLGKVNNIYKQINNMKQSLNEEFSRMQKLAGINSDNMSDDNLIEIVLNNYIKTHGLLSENQLNEVNLKKFISGVKDSFSKNQLPKFNNLLAGLKETGKPTSILLFLNILKKLGIDLKDKKELSMASYILMKQGKKLKEEDIEFDEDEGDIVTKGGRKYYKFTNALTGEVEYLDQKATDEFEKEIFAPKRLKGGDSILGKLRKFFGKNGGKLLLAAFAAAPLYAGLADELGDAAKFAGFDLNGVDAPSQESERGLANAGFDSEEIDKYLDSEFAVDVGGQSGGIVDDIKALDGDNDNIDLGDLASDNSDVSDAKEQGLEINADKKTTVNFTKFDNGSSQLDDQNLSKIHGENETIIKFLQNGQDYSETILGTSSNTGENSNLDNDGGDLNANRETNTTEAILDDLESQLKDSQIKYTRNANTITLEDGGTYTLDPAGTNDPATLDLIDKTDDTATQSAIRLGVIGDEPPDPTVLFGFDPVRPEEDEPSVKDKASEKPKEKEKETGKEKNKEKTEIIPAKPNPTDIENISKFNRNGQIGFVLARTSPKLNIYSELGEKNITNFTDNNLNDIIKGEYKGNQTSDNAKKLAKLILNLRKSPDSLTKKYAKVLGVTLKPRAKAISTQPGKGTQAQLQKVQEIKNRTLLYLNEAMIDNIFSEFGVTDDDIISKKVQLLSLLGSMYASEEDNTLSILDTKSLSDKEKQQLQGLGFSPQAGGNYVFLGKGQTRASYFDKLQDKNKTQPDVERAAKTISGRNTLKSLLKRIDTVDEFRDLIIALLKNINPDFVSDKTKVKSVLFQLRNRIKEAETKDTTATIDAILKDSTIVSLFQKINTIEEAIQLILRDIIPYLNPSLLKDKTKLKNAIIGAANAYNKKPTSNTPSTSTKTSSTSNTSSTGTTNVNYTLTKENKNMKKPLLNEEFSRMQKLAGIITEEMIGGVNFDAQAAAEIKLEQPDLSKLAPYILDKGDKVIMTNSGKICIYDGSTLKKTYNDVESFLTGISYSPMKLK
jgi:hypothetical protein